MQPRRRRCSENLKDFRAAAARSGIFLNFLVFSQKIDHKSVFLEIRHFTDAENYFCKRRRTSLLYFAKIHHNILNIFHQITLLLSDAIKQNRKTD